MTYLELLNVLKTLPAERLNDDVTVYLPSDGEMYAICHALPAKNGPWEDSDDEVIYTDQLDTGHLVLGAVW